MTTTEERSAIAEDTEELLPVVSDTPIYDHTFSLALAEGRNPFGTLVIPEPTKRQRHDAGRLTGKVWDEICAARQKGTTQ